MLGGGAARAGIVASILAILFALQGSLRAEPPAARRAKADRPDQSKLPKSAEPLTEEAIRQILAKPITLDFHAVPLADVAAQLEKSLGVPVRLDKRALSDANIATDAKVTFSLAGIPARTAVRLMLQDLDLGIIVHDGVVRVTTEEVAEGEEGLILHVYEVGDLVDRSGGVAISGGVVDFDPLVQLIVSSISPHTWVDFGGLGTIKPLAIAGAYVLVVRQTLERHDDIESLLTELRSLRHGRSADKHAVEGRDPPTAAAGGVRPALEAAKISPACQRARAISKTLNRLAPIQNRNRTLTEWAEVLRQETGLPVLLDRRSLAEADFDPKRELTIETHGQNLKAILEELRRDYVIRFMDQDGVLLLTTRARADGFVEARCYDVSDLPAFCDGQGNTSPDYDALLIVITGSLSPSGWADMGGLGQIKPFDGPGIQSLAVAQTWRMHEQLEDLLAKLRAARPRPLTKEYLLTLPPVPAQPGPWDGGPGEAPEPRETRSISADPACDAVATASNQFALDFYARARTQSNENLAFSPCSLSTALGMIYAGARSKTANEISRALHFNQPPESISAGFRSLRAELPLGRSPGRELALANRLWGQVGYQFNETFLTTTRDHFGAEMAQVDFAQPEAVRNQINQWTAQNTRDLIREIVSPGDIDHNSRFVLTSALYFHGKWSQPFQRDQTAPASFASPSGATRVSMMHQEATCGYFESSYGLQLLEKSYVGDALSMIILLPPRGTKSLSVLEDSLSKDFLDESLAVLEKRTVNVYLPKFSTDSTYDLKSSLVGMGVLSLFQIDKADLSGMASGGQLPLYLSGARHRCFVRADEEGTEAAAVTAMAGAMGGMASRVPPPVFRADHPFIFLICDVRTGCILFMGRVMQPTLAGN